VARHIAEPLGLPVEQAAHGMLRIAAATMMRAIRAVSVERGRDPRDFALLAFGGNGPLFAAAIAAELGIRRVIVPPLPGLFSAFGLLVADTEHHAGRSLRARVDTADPARLRDTLRELEDAAAAQLAADGFPPAQRRVRRSAAARYVGQSTELAVELPDGDATMLLAALPILFAEEHARVYGFRAPADEPVELVGLGVIAHGIPAEPRLPEKILPISTRSPATRRAWLDGPGWTALPVIDRAELGSGTRRGPLIVQEYDATCLVPQGAAAALDRFGSIVLTLDA
jgi:N-methylhydantoinase A